MKRSSIAAFAVLAIGCLPVMASAAMYSFTNIFDDNDAGSNLVFDAPSINNAGEVAFRTQILFSTDEQILRVADGVVTTIATNSPSGPFQNFFLGEIEINDGGTVVFFANLNGSIDEGIFTNNGGGVRTIVQSGGPAGTSFGFAPSINAAGNIAFFGDEAFGPSPEGIFVTSDGPSTNPVITTVVDNSGFFTDLGEFPSINNDRTVAFGATVEILGVDFRGIFTRGGGISETIADDLSGPVRFFNGSPEINADGTVVFAAELDTGVEGIFTGNGGPITTIADANDGFADFRNSSVAINASGTVAFQAELDIGGNGIFTGDDVVADKVIREGDPLFGSTVTGISFIGGLNDSGQIAFVYALDNDISGIAVASVVPEPATWALVMLGGLVIMSGRRRFGRR